MSYPHSIAKAKDPAATLDYSLDWRDWLAAGETVSSHVVTAPAGITLVSDSAASGIVSFRLSGGTAGRHYDITVEITTSIGQVDQRTIRVPVSDR